MRTVCAGAATQPGIGAPDALLAGTRPGTERGSAGRARPRTCCRCRLRNRAAS